MYKRAVKNTHFRVAERPIGMPSISGHKYMNKKRKVDVITNMSDACQSGNRRVKRTSRRALRNPQKTRQEHVYNPLKYSNDSATST